MATAIATAHRQHRPVIVGIGAHVIKVGLAPLLVHLMEQGIVTAVAMNGAGINHDFELALMGHTSEEVDAEIDEGRFGMAEDTGRILNEAITLGAQHGQGLGEAVGHYINLYQGQFPNRATSPLATGAKLGIPVTVHVAIGTDIIHMHPAARENIPGFFQERLKKLRAIRQTVVRSNIHIEQNTCWLWKLLAIISNTSESLVI